MAAAAAAHGDGDRPRSRSATALRTFPGVPHRLERVAEIDGVLYVNDSKATNVAAAAAALRSFDGGVRAILGGSLKGGGFEGLAEPVAERCVACYLIGEAADAARARARPGRAAGVELRRCDGPRGGGAAAAADAQPGRGGAARAGLRELRRLPRLRGARRALPARWSRSSGDERRSSPQAGSGRRPATKRRRAADRVHAAAHRDPVPARVRRRDGVQRQLDDLAARPERATAPTTSSERCCSARSAWCVHARCSSVRGAQGAAAADAAAARSPRSASCCAVLLPGIGGVGERRQPLDRRPGSFQIQPSELAKLALILYGANLLAERPADVARGPDAGARISSVVGDRVPARWWSSPTWAPRSSSA